VYVHVRASKSKEEISNLKIDSNKNTRSNLRNYSPSLYVKLILKYLELILTTPNETFIFIQPRRNILCLEEKNFST
jgi:hypothetical protein